jgi:hypothetical protein
VDKSTTSHLTEFVLHLLNCRVLNGVCLVSLQVAVIQTRRSSTPSGDGKPSPSTVWSVGLPASPPGTVPTTRSSTPRRTASPGRVLSRLRGKPPKAFRRSRKSGKRVRMGVPTEWVGSLDPIVVPTGVSRTSERRPPTSSHLSRISLSLHNSFS